MSAALLRGSPAEWRLKAQQAPDSFSPPQCHTADWSAQGAHRHGAASAAVLVLYGMAGIEVPTVTLRLRQRPRSFSFPRREQSQDDAFL